MKKLSYLSVLAAASAFATPADAFVNGGFETGSGSSPTGWTLQSGTWDGPYPNNIYSTGNYGSDSQIITNNTLLDANTGNKLYQVYSGSQSFRLGDQNGGQHWASAGQTFATYNESHLYFAFAAVVQDAGHGASDQPRFELQIKDVTTNTMLYLISVTGDSNNGVRWNNGVGDWRYTDWTVVDLDTSGILGHSVSVLVESFDCAFGGHGGYAYIDGFSSLLAPTPNPGVNSYNYGAVPEPSTYGLMLGGLALAGVVIRRRRAK